MSSILFFQNDVDVLVHVNRLPPLLLKRLFSGDISSCLTGSLFTATIATSMQKESLNHNLKVVEEEVVELLPFFFSMASLAALPNYPGS